MKGAGLFKYVWPFSGGTKGLNGRKVIYNISWKIIVQESLTFYYSQKELTVLAKLLESIEMLLWILHVYVDVYKTKRILKICYRS